MCWDHFEDFEGARDENESHVGGAGDECFRHLECNGERYIADVVENDERRRWEIGEHLDDPSALAMAQFEDVVALRQCAENALLSIKEVLYILKICFKKRNYIKR